MDSSAWVTLGVGVAQCFIAIWLGKVAIRTLGATEKAASAADDSAKIAIESLRTAERAWVCVPGVKFNSLDSGAKPVITFMLRNTGSSIAIMKQVYAGLCHGALPKVDEFQSSHALPTSGVISPGEEITVTLSSAEVLHHPDPAEVAVLVEYEDIFAVKHLTCRVFAVDWNSGQLVIWNRPDYTDGRNN